MPPSPFSHLTRLIERSRQWLRDSLSKEAESLGRRGERCAEKVLRTKGYRIIERGLRTSHGELDLIALDGRTVVFVEVKTRATNDPMAPVEAVDKNKQRQITHLALAFQKKHGLLEESSRFDIVAINWPAAAARPVIRHYENAFEPTGRGQMFS